MSCSLMSRNGACKGADGVACKAAASGTLSGPTGSSEAERVLVAEGQLGSTETRKYSVAGSLIDGETTKL